MKPSLTFATMEIPFCTIGNRSPVPDVYGGGVIQNQLEFCLDEDDEIFEGYGRRRNSYPYRQFSFYNRNLSPRLLHTAILENDFIKAVFLPELGGRLWELYDKQTGQNLLYTNDVIRYSNLAVCNAWFSGGVEWNIGIIGHTPFTCEPVYTARLSDSDGNPVLRMYEYERIRGVEYQMDFWLDTEHTFLNCRMRIVNSTTDVVPMYWWSNIAVPENDGGRVIVPAESAFTSDMRKVYKVSIPEVNGTDISFYANIPDQVDYFFDIPQDAPKYIAHINHTGYGLLHVSTGRLRSRKMFSWGHNTGSRNWQHFLTKSAGPYLEIQAGLGKTQYGCIPMAPHTAWEWIELYGPTKVDSKMVTAPYRELEAHIRKKVTAIFREQNLETVLQERKSVALTPGMLIQTGSGAGALAAAIKTVSGERPLSAHLCYDFTCNEQKAWAHFLTTGIAPVLPDDTAPAEFLCERYLYDLLQQNISSPENTRNWYARYTLALLHAYYDNIHCAIQEMKIALQLSENPWTCHGYASLLCLGTAQNRQQATQWIQRGIMMRQHDTAYVKEMFHLLLVSGGNQELVALYPKLPEQVASESRIKFDYMVSLKNIGRYDEARLLLTNDFILDDLRECEDSISELWKELYQDSGEPVPEHWNFESLGK